jgi:uncharacterized membrane protein YesL
MSFDYKRGFWEMKVRALLIGVALFGLVLFDGYYIAHITNSAELTTLHAAILAISALIILSTLIYFPPHIEGIACEMLERRR